MKIKTLYPSTTDFPDVSAEDKKLAERILTTNLGLKTQEQVLVVTDDVFFSLSQMWFMAAKSLSAPVTLIVIEGMTRSGEQPPEEVLALCGTAQVVVMHTQFSLTHTDASKVARENGARVASMPGATLDIISRTLSRDYEPVRTLGIQLQASLSQAKTIQITSDAGTNMTALVRQDNIIVDNGFILSGEVGNLPAGEVFFAPLEGTANGTWVVNGSMSSETLDTEIRITVVDGMAVEIDGGQSASRLKEKLAKVGPNAFVIAEIGIGTNPYTDPMGKLLEAEKAYGTAHMAMGNNFFFGGQNNVPIHLDGVTLSPTIALDGRVILQGGKFTF